MEKNILENSLKINDMVKESLNGKMVENMRGNGLRESNMVSESIETPRVRKEKVSG